MFCSAIRIRNWSASERKWCFRHFCTSRATVSRFSSWCFICGSVMGTKNRFSSRSGRSLSTLSLVRRMRIGSSVSAIFERLR